jgi:hypothetical protein
MNVPIIARAAIAAAILLSLAACGSSSEKSKGDSAAASSGGSTNAKTDTKDQEAAKEKLAVGDETTLKGLHGSMKVKVLKVEDPMKAPPAKGLIREVPRKGNRFVGVQVVLTNVGDQAYSDSILNGARLVTDVDKGSQPTILLSGKCRSKFGTKTRVAAGASKRGCLPFQVKKKAKVSAFELTLDSGYGPEKGNWAVH